MTIIHKEEVLRLFPILEAIKEGKTIQFHVSDGWRDIDGDDEGFYLETLVEETSRYRIKPEPKYRPFKCAKECWNEMQKHQPVGWVKQINDKGLEVFIHCGVIKRDWILTDVDEEPFPFDKIYNNYTFVDGTPFGVKMEE